MYTWVRAVQDLTEIRFDEHFFFSLTRKKLFLQIFYAFCGIAEISLHYLKFVNELEGILKR